MGRGSQAALPREAPIRQHAFDWYRKAMGNLSGPQKARVEAKLKQSLGDAYQTFILPKEMTLELGGNVTMKLVLIPAGSFVMGSPASEKGRLKIEGPQHGVRISRPFYMGIYPVTQEQYEQIAEENQSKFRSPSNPIENVTWYQAEAFCEKLSQKTGQLVRLPTEAQWEYACRAGTTTAFNVGKTISADDANFNGHVPYPGSKSTTWRAKTIPVGSFKPNAWGLYDMHGNVAQYCRDLYDDTYYARSPALDPPGPTKSKYRDHIVRGGGYSAEAAGVRSASRDACEIPRDHIGFRVIVELH